MLMKKTVASQKTEKESEKKHGKSNGSPQQQETDTQKRRQQKVVRQQSKRTKKTKSAKQETLFRGKRKKALAIVTIKPGKGKVRINGRSIDSYSNPLFKHLVLEPLLLSNTRDMFDVRVNVRSGGIIGQAQAIRRAIATAIVNYTKSQALKEAFVNYDRSLLVEDYRRIEPKKYLGRKARARFQKSYR